MGKRIYRKGLGFAVSIFIIIAIILIGSTVSGFASTNAFKDTRCYKYYTSIMIEPGDSLWEIASEYMTSEYDDIDEYISEVRTLNHIVDDKITAGEYLTIPYYSSELL
ncbi:MAG: LysM peptidoglycan-binding domain-containing protein [Lachnospiraceae bacterium]|nr:LysM peptidoglycan-binding domain-containing protein [Lachnospiraceae bacterium]